MCTGTACRYVAGLTQPTFNPLDPQEQARPGTTPQTSDLVLLNRLVTASRRFRKGDVVTLLSPQDPHRLITKRILALGGDTVHVWVPKGAELTPPSRRTSHDHVESLAYTNVYQDALRDLAHEVEEHGTGAWMSIRIPPNCAWVEGDASVHQPVSLRHLAPSGQSRDSREFGPVPLSLVTSRIEWILWPPTHWGAPGPRPV